MIYFKRPDGQVFAYATEQERETFGAADLIRMTDDEVLAHLEPAGAAQMPRFAPLEFLDLFPEAVQLSVVQATQTNASVKLWYDRVLAATYITLDDPRVEAGLDALVSAGLLADADRAAVLAAMGGQ